MFFIGSCIFSGIYLSFRFIGPKWKIDLTENSRYFSIFSEEGWNVKMYTYIESARRDLQNDMQIYDICKISNFLMWYKFWITILREKNLSKIWWEKNFDIFFKTIDISYIGIL